MSDAPLLSVVIPAYEEARRLPEPLREIGKFLAARPGAAEIVVVDDGSRDDTFGVAREVAETLDVPVEVVRYAPNRGKGFALKVGFSRTRGERVLFTDADLSTPIASADALLQQLDAGHDVAIGSRWLRGAQLGSPQPWYRIAMGAVFTLLVRALVARVSDATCGFKAYRGDAGRELFAHSRISRWSFDAEILWLAHVRRLSLAEVPVPWSDVEGTKVTLSSDALRSGLELLQIRWNALRGRYAAPQQIDLPLEIWSNR